jgi:hypothetical protein
MVWNELPSRRSGARAPGLVAAVMGSIDADFIDASFINENFINENRCASHHGSDLRATACRLGGKRRGVTNSRLLAV